MWNLDDSSPNAPLTSEMISAAEEELGVRFPASYIDALRIKNGGSIIGDLIRLPQQHIPVHLERYIEQGYVSIRGINGIGAGDASVLGTTYLIAEWELPEHWLYSMVMATGGSHLTIVNPLKIRRSFSWIPIPEILCVLQTTLRSSLAQSSVMRTYLMGMETSLARQTQHDNTMPAKPV